MNNKITKLATAAAIIIAAGLFFTIMEKTTTPVWADIIQPILNARTAAFEIIIGDEDSGAPVIYDEIMGSRIRRTMAGIDEVTIIDLEALKILSLDHEKKQATFIDLKGMPKIPNYLEMIKTLLTEIQDSPEFYTETLEEQVLDGRNVYGIRAFHPKVELTIWVDAETDLPTRIEQQENQLKVICRNMQFDVPMDESMFSMDVPDGYKQSDQTLDLTGATEEQFLDFLRILTEVVFDGIFPEDISIEYYIKQVSLIREKFDAIDISDEEKTEIGMQMAQGMMFIRFFKGQGKWYYKGSGVEFGDEQAPVFWYHPNGSETWRVIYGDLHVEDVAQQDLPEPPDQQTQESDVKYQQWLDSKFVGTEEDVWHITADHQIQAHSYIKLMKGPQDTSEMPIVLPYGNAVLESVLVNDQQADFQKVHAGQYNVPLTLQDGQTVNIECIWTMPLDTLKNANDGYRTRLQALTHVTSFKLTVALNPDCGFVHTKDPAQTTVAYFSWNTDKPKITFGSCGIMIREE